MIKTLRESKARLSELVERAARGEDVIITVRGKPKARLTGAGGLRRLDAHAWADELRSSQRAASGRRKPSRGEPIVDELREENADDDSTERASYTADPGDGIVRFRWARSVNDVHRVLGNDRADELGAVPILNSWGRDYPHRTWMPDDVLQRLMDEEGEVAVPTDR